MNKKFKKLKTKIIKENPFVLLTTSVMAIILLYCLVLTPVIGKADNGDFGRMYNSFGLADMASSYEEQYDYYFHQTFRFINCGFLLPWDSSWVMGCWLGKIPLVFNFIFNLLFNFDNLNLFDIRFLGILYSLIFLTGIYLILNYNKLSNLSKCIGGLFIILFFTDGIYISYFNSFFGEGTTICTFFLTIGSFLFLISDKEPSKNRFIFFFISSACFLTSKTQQLPLLIFMLIIYVALYIFYKNHRKLISISSILVTSLCIITFFSISEYTNKNNIYQSVFNGVLHNSDTPEKDLEFLNINPKFSCNAGSGFYAQDLKYKPLGNEMLEEFYPNISLGKILNFYISHPLRAWENIKDSTKYAYSFYAINEKNFLKGIESENKLVNRFRFNLIQNNLELHRNIFIYISFSLIYLIVITIYFFKSSKREVKLLCLLLLFLLASGSSQLVLPVLGSGFSDIGKHMFLLNLAYDVLLGTVLIWICNNISKIIKKLSN